MVILPVEAFTVILICSVSEPVFLMVMSAAVAVPVGRNSTLKLDDGVTMSELVGSVFTTLVASAAQRVQTPATTVVQVCVP